MNNRESEAMGTPGTEPVIVQSSGQAAAVAKVAPPDPDAGSSQREFPSVTSAVGAGPIRTPLPEANRPAEPVPVWLSVLVAARCSAKRNGEHHAVRWDCVAGRAVYTNLGRDAEHIEPLGVSLLSGQTLAVYWVPGETAYTLEVYRHREKCA
jgi:hypothetical protein